MDEGRKQSYGDTLFDVAAAKKIPHTVLSTTMCEDKKNLRERLNAIMKSKRHTCLTIVGSAVLLATAIVLAITLGAGRTTAQNAATGSSITELAFDNLDRSVTPGVGLSLAYESDEFIIFYGCFGLFGYNLEQSKMVFEVDFVKAFGQTCNIQGDYGVTVEVSPDGQYIILSYTNPINPDFVHDTYFIDIPTLAYTRGAYEPMTDVFVFNGEGGQIRESLDIGSTFYTRGGKEWLPFEKYATGQSGLRFALYPGVPADTAEATPIIKDTAGWYPLTYVVSAVVTCPWNADITLYFAGAGTEATPIPIPFPKEKIDTHMLRLDVGNIFRNGFLGHVWVVAIDVAGIEHSTEIINVIYEPTSSMSLLGSNIQIGMTEAESELIVTMIEMGVWDDEGTSDCIADYMFRVSRDLFYYHLECGTINDDVNERSLLLSEEQRKAINQIVESYTFGLNVPDEIPVINANNIGSEISRYITDDGLSWVSLLDNGRFCVEGRPVVSYRPEGSYGIYGGKLYLNISDDQQFVFQFDGRSLVFESGEWLENWVPKGSVFSLAEDR